MEGSQKTNQRIGPHEETVKLKDITYNKAKGNKDVTKQS